MERYGSRAVNLFLENIQFKLGDGKRIKFRLDAWASSTPLSILYSRLFSLATNKDSLVYHHMQQSMDNHTQWNIDYRRCLRVWEEELHHEMISRLQQPHTSRRNYEDALIWTPMPTGSFSVKSLYDAFEDSLRLSPFPIMKLWKSLAPRKIKAFGSLVLWDRIASSDLLARRQIIPTSNHCAFCGIENETAAHLLLHCHHSW
ncbi:hypothetical protein CsSME_00007036 [Camellia sinensis var. sinensis]